MKENLTILLLGNGGRESAIAWKLMQSPRLKKLYVAPGNGSPLGEPVALNILDFEAMADFCSTHAVDMIMVGPELPLVQGIADHFADSPVKVIGPCAEGARLEGSKEFAKEFMTRHAIPTARFMTVTADTIDEGYSFLESLSAPYVLKADGLAAGKGVLITHDLDEARSTLASMLGGLFGSASATVVIEEFMAGVECSVFVATDGEEYVMLPAAKDYKRAGEGDTGLNTGGMGAVSPVPFADAEFLDKVERRIVRPTLGGLREEGIPYRGFLFIGLMDVEGDPMVVEYNVRLGDPETEVVIPRIASDMVDLLEGIADQTLAVKKVLVDERAAAAVMVVSDGYPGKYATGKAISGLDRIGKCADAVVFHAGTRRDSDTGMVYTAGGRVLATMAFGADLRQAVDSALRQAALVSFDGARFRADIGADMLKLL